MFIIPGKLESNEYINPPNQQATENRVETICFNSSDPWNWSPNQYTLYYTAMYVCMSVCMCMYMYIYL